jgi:hypothetical protein
MRKNLIVIIPIFLFSIIGCSENSVMDNSIHNETIHSSDILTSQTWEKGTHVIDGQIVVKNAVLTIEAGATIIFKQNGRLIASTNGGIVADGTSELIVFTGEKKQTGYWEYVEFAFDAVSEKSVLKNVVLEYGGGNPTVPYVLRVFNESTIMNSTIRLSASNGVYISENINPTFINNVITENSGYPLEMDFSSCNCLRMGTGSLKGNGKNFVLLDEKSLTAPATLGKIDVPYRFKGTFNIEAPAVLTIEGGNRCEMTSHAKIIVQAGAGLIAVGNSRDPLLFTGVMTQPGFWDYIQFKAGSGNNSRMENCILEYGGGFAGTSGIIDVKSSPVLVNCTIRHSASNGIAVDTSSGTDTNFSNLVFSDIAGQDIILY